MRAGAVIAILAGAATLTACISVDTVPLPTPAADPTAHTPCDYYRDYTDETNRSLATGIAALRKSNLPGRQAIDGALSDFHKMREACRAAGKGVK